MSNGIISFGLKKMHDSSQFDNGAASVRGAHEPFRPQVNANVRLILWSRYRIGKIPQTRVRVTGGDLPLSEGSGIAPA